MQVIANAAHGTELVAEARRLDGPNTLVMIFATRQALQSSTVVSDVHSAFPASVVVGGSSAGHFIGESLEDETPMVIVIRFEHTVLRHAVVPLEAAEDSRAAAEKLAAELAMPGLKGVLVLSDGTTSNGSALVDGLVDRLGDHVAIFGGLAADGDAFVETLTIGGGRAKAKQVVAVGFASERLVLRGGTAGGWTLLGPERTITDSAGTVLKVLDGEPALDLYRRYLGERADELPGSALLFPLAIREPDAEFDHRVVRTVLGVDEDAKTMTFAGEIPTGWRAQLMRASFDGLIDGAADAAEKIGRADEVVGQSLCLGVSCVGRRLVLGTRVEEELEVVTEITGSDTTVAGFYSYGEVGPGRSGRCELHNQTMALTFIGER